MYQVSSKKILVIGLLVIFLGGLAFNATRAEEKISLHIIGPNKILGIGAEFPLKIVVDAESPINAYQVELKFSAQNLEVIGTNDAGSIIDIARDQPKVYENGSLTFSGASLNPFEGEGGLLLTVNFRVLGVGLSELSFGDSAVYLANGKGTKVRVEGEETMILSEEGVAVTKEAAVVDEAPPNVLNLSLTEDPINPEQKLLGFLVKDDSTGVRQTFVQYRRWLTWSDLEVAQNPMALPKNAWAVKFQAFDNTGNVSEKIIYDWKAFIYYDLLVLLLLLTALGVVMNRILRRKRV